MQTEMRLAELGIELPEAPVFTAEHITRWREPFVAVDRLVFLGGNSGRINGELKYVGKVGREVSLEQGYEMARRAALNHLAILKAALGDLDRIARVVRVAGYINVDPEFTEMPKVLNGESDLLVDVLGERGKHTRLATGVASMPGNAPLEIELLVEIDQALT